MAFRYLDDAAETPPTRVVGDESLVCFEEIHSSGAPISSRFAPEEYSGARVAGKSSVVDAPVSVTLVVRTVVGGRIGGPVDEPLPIGDGFLHPSNVVLILGE